MAKYDLLLNVTAVPNPVPSPPKPQGQAVKPWGPTNPTSPPAEQTFQLAVVGVGAVSASVQILVSNDTGDDPSQYNWVPFGDPITAAGTNNGQVASSGSQAWRHFGAYLTAISGTNAAATMRMSA